MRSGRADRRARHRYPAQVGRLPVLGKEGDVKTKDTPKRYIVMGLWGLSAIMGLQIIAACRRTRSFGPMKEDLEQARQFLIEELRLENPHWPGHLLAVARRQERIAQATILWEASDTQGAGTHPENQ